MIVDLIYEWAKGQPDKTTTIWNVTQTEAAVENVKAISGHKVVATGFRFEKSFLVQKLAREKLSEPC
jgi:hypothetical protein